MLGRIIFIGCLVILLAQAALQVVLAKADSPTTDEPVHVLAGYTYLTRHDFRLNPEHPPLVKVISALPLLALKPNLPADFEQKWQDSEDFFYDSWRENRYLGEQFFYNSGNDTEALVFWSRLPMVGITFLLGLTIFLIAWRHFGTTGALAATGFFALDPLVTGHGHLVTTDVAFGLGVLLASYAAWRFFTEANWRNSFWLGLALGLTLLTKHTAVILVAILLVAAVGTVLANRQKVLPMLKGSAVAALTVWLVIWAGHGFSARPAPPAQSVSEQIQQDNAKAVGKVFEGTSLAGREDLLLTEEELSETGQQVGGFDKYYPILQPILKILPGDYFKGLLLVAGHASGGHDSFLLGQNSNTGWWYYFPTLLLLKIPLSTLAALAMLVYSVARYRPRRNFAAFALTVAGLFLLSAMTAKANIGLRHIFPVLPLVFVGFGWLAGAGKYTRETLLGLLVLLAVTFVGAYPNYLGYFNELSGAKEKNYLIAADSNLDWGQDLKRIRRYVDKNQLEKPVIEYGWLGHDALKYYLGDNFRHLYNTPVKKGDVLITGVTALNRTDWAAVFERCGPFELITNGTFACRISR